MKRYEVQRITHLPRQILALEKEAVGEGFRFLTRLINEWQSGANRFDAPGECLMAAYLNQQLIGMHLFPDRATTVSLLNEGWQLYAG